MQGSCQDERVSGPAHLSTPVGWREWVGMPGIGLPWLKAKVDTGARTSSLHAEDVEEFDRDGEPWVRFTLHPWQDAADDPRTIECAVHDRRSVRSSSGHVTKRFVVRLDLALGGRTVPAEVTLSKRDRMGFRMLIGRGALRGAYVAAPAGSSAGGSPPKAVRRRTRGRCPAGTPSRGPPPGTTSGSDDPAVRGEVPSGGGVVGG